MQYSSATRLNEIAARLRSIANSMIEQQMILGDELKDMYIEIGSIVEED